jgi:alpha-L-rhamnosidase
MTSSLPTGGQERTYRPLWWRAFRYIELSIETGAQSLTVLDFKSDFSTYPFERKAQFKMEGLAPGQADTLQKILEIGERTVRLNAHETFMDCPYYEESQFEGDTRVQALISYVLFGDGALGKNAIEQFSWSINSEGFLSARYPTNSTYYIPNYNIYWIGMLYDYMMYFGEREYIRSKLPVLRQLMGYFLERERADGTIRKPDYHNFVDWALPRGEGPFDEDGYSALVDLHVLLALQWASALETYAGEAYLKTGIAKKPKNWPRPSPPFIGSQHKNALPIRRRANTTRYIPTTWPFSPV